MNNLPCGRAGRNERDEAAAITSLAGDGASRAHRWVSGSEACFDRQRWNMLRSMDPIVLGLPHRAPFVFIETVEAHEPGTMATATKTFSGQEPFFQGHFPGNPIVPGVLLTEGMAQTAGIAMADRDHVFLLTAIQSMKFLRPVRPNERISFSARASGTLLTLCMCEVKAEVASEVVAEGRIVLARGPHRIR